MRTAHDGIARRVDRFEAYLESRPELRLRVSCPSQEFSRLEMGQQLGHWLSCVRGLWESLDVTAQPDLALVMFQAPRVPAAVVRYLLGLHPPLDAIDEDRHRRHLLIDLDDDSEVHLSEKLLARPDVLERVRALITRARRRGQIVEDLSCFQSSARMDAIAAALDLGSCETPSGTLSWGSKAGSRQIFRSAGISHPPGTYEALRDLRELADQAAQLTARHGPGRWMVKINEGCGSGHGNAVFTVDTASREAILAELRHLRPLVESVPRGEFFADVASHGAIVERYLDTPPAGEKHFPSALLFIRHTPGQGTDAQLLGTHDQILDDKGQFLGCRFPAAADYRRAVIELSRAVGDRLGAAGVRGHVGIDFIARRTGGASWDISATEINLRQTGTTHPHRTVRALVPGTWHGDGRLTHNGTEVFYTATDALSSGAYRGVPPRTLIQWLSRRPDLSFDFHRARGVVPHFWTALEPFGRIGATVIGTSQEECGVLQERFTDLLDGLSEGVSGGPARRSHHKSSPP
jgi:hypothetical protein